MSKQIGIVFAFTCISCAPVVVGQEHFVRATPLCRVLMDEQKYAGQQVLVSALLFYSPEGPTLSSPGCDRAADLDSSSDTWERHAKAVIDAALAKNKRAAVPVVVSGVFQPWTRYEGGKQIIRAGGPAIGDARIIAARQP